MRYLKYAFLVLVAILLVTVAMANRATVELKLLPAALAELVGYQGLLFLPLYAVILGGVVVGLVLGFVWEWLREYRIRREAERRRRQVNLLARENERLREKAHEGEDDVLALLDRPAR
ncbi:uncharacterized protein DUF1049 [Hasllibacter halocynthiae]|uniref:Uncharacterized protein DUF1049 n=1 Tax=Hasllibacter halocynthiae TaxID=595589 RepID=A0A2T0X4A5_9RHOB|nr:lipopolysaccharide assembly protein LapA domain-containing protein [Hasllibacter halocynthiae]PRY93772.1 uncharacterized protein DUF1049 [Hasllibacter halocynthiae]